MYAGDNGVRVKGLDDSHSYLFVLNSRLEPLYVEETGGTFSWVIAFPVRTPEGLRLLTVSSSLYLQEHNTSELRLYNHNSFLVEKIYTIPLLLQFTGATGLIVDDVTGDGQPNYIVGTETGKLYLFNWNLEVVNTRHNSIELPEDLPARSFLAFPVWLFCGSRKRQKNGAIARSSWTLSQPEFFISTTKVWY
ncbi:MAG: hypothetical protein ACE5IR_13110 [bacterium]